MVDAIVSRLFKRLISIAAEEVKQEVRLVVGVDREVENLKINFEAIQAVLHDAERRQEKDESVRLWLDQLKYTSYDMEDVLDEWVTARLKLQIEGGLDDQESVRTHVPQQKVCSFLPASCFCFNVRVGLRRDIAIKVKELNERLDDIAGQQDMFGFSVIWRREQPERIPTIPVVDTSEVYGRDDEKIFLLSKLLSESSENEKGLHIISIVGMGGVGKTTLAQLAYNCYEVKRYFDRMMWVCVSENFDLVRIARSIVEALEGSTPNLGDFQSLMHHISRSVVGRRFFIVFDDVWNEDYSKWEPFVYCLKNGIHGNKILITTRSEAVARMVGSTDIITVGAFSEDAAWSLFCQIAFSGRSSSERKHLEEIGRKIVHKCKGLPLAIKTAGHLLRAKRTEREWQKILDSALWEVEEFERRLFAPLNEHLDDIVATSHRFGFSVTMSLEQPERIQTTPLVDISEVYGRDDEKNFLMSKLLSESSENEKGLHIISIVGMGGVGKTTLAQLAYNSYEVAYHFEQRVWVCVSENFDMVRIARSIVEALEGSTPNLGDFQSLMHHISRSVVGRRFFIVFDDVWNEDYSKWEPFVYCLKNGFHGSKILITTRSEAVARMVGSTDIITVGTFSEDAAWSLFCQIAFSGRSSSERKHLEEIGRKIVHKCKGLPLAIKTVGHLLHAKQTKREWQSILHSELWEVEEFERGLLAPLLLSYNDLPSIVKICFSYCAIFPKDFQINKDKLIKLWMAQGYLGMGESEEMEIIGEEYFDLLVKRSFFQDFEEDDNGNILTCKMHDIVHDFARYLTKNESLTMEVNDGLQEIYMSYDYELLRHIMLVLNEGASFPVSVCRAKSVRSLLIQYGVTNCSSISEILPAIFNQLTSLRALDLSGQFWYEKVIIRIPEGIERLILLRYLNLSSLKMKELPEKLCELCNLQTLELWWCTNLRKLPEGMEKLIRLRHLVNVETSLSYIPRGIERLTSLRTLSEFVVSGDSKACTLACLKNLNQLQGSLSIKNLGSVTDFSVVKEANLQEKSKIIRLYLNFEIDAEEVRMNKDDGSKMSTDERVLEALQPPPNLEFLEIRGYKGKASFPDCIMSLSVLRTLNLHSCTNLYHLPPLGKLPSLESLSISSMRTVRVGNELLGISIGASSSSSVIVFPKLKFLKFVNMEEWEDWDCGTTLPSLRFLSLVYCPKLKALPGHILQTGTLEELTINWCTVLEERYNKTGEDLHNISQIPNIIINFEFVKRGRP